MWPQEEMRTRLERKKFIKLTDSRGESLHAVQGQRGSSRFWSGGKDRSKRKL